MRRLIFICILLSVTSSIFAQSTGTAGGGSIVLPPIAVPAPISFVSSNSVVDQNGNVLIFDQTFTATRNSSSPVAVPTRVSVISADGRTVNEYNFTGSFQIVGVGHDAVYAIVENVSISAGSPTFTGISTSTTTSTVSSFTYTRTLVALRVVAATLPATLPSLNLSTDQDVKLSPGAGLGSTDVIAVISGNTFLIPTPLASSTAVTVNPHVVSLYTSDGTTFTPNLHNPITTH